MHSYREFDPPSSLAPFVHCLWHFEQSVGGAPDVIVPDGRPELIVHLAAPYFETDTDVQQPPVLFAGQLTKPLKIEARGPAKILGVRFRPDGARSFLGYSVACATDKRLPLSAFSNEGDGHLIDPLRAAQNDQERRSRLAAWVLLRVDRCHTDPVIRDLVNQIFANEPLRLPPHPHLRQLQRRFKRSVGVSMRTLVAIRRFRSVFDRIQFDQSETWVQRALETGYFDQPQLSRDFQRFLGCSARQWAQISTGLGSALSSNQG